MKNKIFLILCAIVVMNIGSLYAATDDTVAVKVINQSSTEENIKNSKFILRDESGKTIQTITINKDGNGTFKPVVPGSYEVEQVSVDSRYILNPSVVDITLDNTMEEYTIVFKNNIKYGSITIQDSYKQVGNKNNGYGLYKSGKLIEQGKTDRNGQLVFDKLEVGDYKVKGLTNQQEQYSFSIIADDQQLYKEFSEFDGYIKIVAYDSSGNAVNGASFDIYDVNGNLIQTIITDSNGEASSSKLENGQYYIVDTNDQNNKYYVNINNKVDTVYVWPSSGNGSTTNDAEDAESEAEANEKNVDNSNRGKPLSQTNQLDTQNSYFGDESNGLRTTDDNEDDGDSSDKGQKTATSDSSSEAAKRTDAVSEECLDESSELSCINDVYKSSNRNLGLLLAAVSVILVVVTLVLLLILYKKERKK